MNKWGFWGTVETVAKVVGILAGLTAGGVAFTLGGWGWASPFQLAAWIVLVVATLGALAQFAIRIKQKDRFTLVFAEANLLGHLGLVIALLRPGFPDLLPLSFAGAYVLGQLAKLVFLRVTGYKEDGNSNAALFGLTVFQAVVYLAFGVLVAL